MSRLREQWRPWLADMLILLLVSWALVLPALQVYMMRQEATWAFIRVVFFSVILSAYAQLPKQARLFAGIGLAIASLAWALLSPLPAALQALISALATARPLTPALTLYSDVILLASLLVIAVYARLLVQGEPSFSAPLLLSTGMMLWFSGARQNIGDFVPLMAAVPLLFAYAGFMENPLRPQVDRNRNRNRSLFKALPVVLMIAMLAFALTPSYRTTHPQLEKQADRLRQLINDYFFFTDTRENFTLASVGYQPMGKSGLGGKPQISNNQVMQVDAKDRLYLRGTLLDLYNGRQWYDSVSNERYGYTSARFAALRDRLLDAALPEEGLRTAEEEASVLLLNSLPSTLFVPQRLRKLSLAEGMVAYLNASSELFITRNLEKDDSYDLAYESYVAGTPKTDQLAARLSGAQDPHYQELFPVYVQLPQHLLPDGMVATLAKQIVGTEQDPYRKAMLIRSHLMDNYRYTLEVPDAPDDLDFSAHFLFETKQGYCTYFATAMTVLARSIGLPSRYVEGFVALPSDNNTPVIITGQNAHAWTEIYIPAMGWVTFDATSTTGELPPPPQQPPPSGPDPDQTPPPGPEEQQTPQPQQEEEQPENAPTPTPEPEDQPPPVDEQDTPEPDQHSQSGPSMWWLWLLLAVTIALLVWRARASEPNRQSARLAESSGKVLLFWQALMDVQKAARLPMLPSETLRDYALRVAPDDRGLLSLANSVSAIVYGRHAPDDSRVTAARLYYQSAYRTLPRLHRGAVIVRRTTRDLRGMLQRLRTLSGQTVRDMKDAILSALRGRR